MTETTTAPILPHRHLTTMTLNVGAAQSTMIGDTPEGRRVIAPVLGGAFSGDRLSGDVAPGGHDWVRYRPDGALIIDVRLVLNTHDGAAIYLRYEGRFLTGESPAKGQALKDEDYSLTIVAKMETGAPAYRWVNDLIIVGVGRQSGYDPTYTLFDVGRPPVWHPPIS